MKRNRQLPFELMALLMEIMNLKTSPIAGFMLINLSKQDMLVDFCSDE